MTREDYNRAYEHFQRNNDGRFELTAPYQILDQDADGAAHGTWCPVYAAFNHWMADVLMRTRPAHHVDFGGLPYFTAIASAVVPITLYDIQPPNLNNIPNVKTAYADLTKLDFADEAFESVSCGHVAEHIGLGRYGDSLDVQGDLKATKELQRVVKRGGQLLIVLPLIGKPRIEFNAHRLYSVDQVLEMFGDLKLKEFTLIAPPEYIQNTGFERARRLTGEGAGCFWFVKE